MKAKYILFLIAIIMIGCDSNELETPNGEDKDPINKILLLQVDYATKKFEGGKEFEFVTPTMDFTIISEYKAPSDFGNVKLLYKELSEPLFEGTIIWMGTGKMTFPNKLNPPSEFKGALTHDYYFPGKGFDVIKTADSPDFEKEDYLDVWSRVQHLFITREYLNANPDQHVKIFLYTPSMGVGDPKTWRWIIFLRNN